MKHKLIAGCFVKDRDGWILEKSRGQNVVHVGCTDEGLIEDRLKQGIHLHANLALTCARLIGVDVDKVGIDRLREQGFEDLLCADIGRDHEQIGKEVVRRMGTCDLIICGEVLEHVLNAGNFLEGVRELAIASRAKVIISVPNAFSLEGFISVGLGTETVHPDHKCYFSQVTLNTLLAQTGFRAVETCFYTTRRAKTRLRKLLKRAIASTVLSIRPQLAEGVIIIAEVDETAD